jgi:hypothetical protein
MTEQTGNGQQATGRRPTPPEGWRELKAAELAELCGREGLARSGNRAELVKRLAVHYHGSGGQHVNAGTACPYCQAYSRVVGTRRPSEGTIARRYRCSGRRRHSFELVEAVKP